MMLRTRLAASPGASARLEQRDQGDVAGFVSIRGPQRRCARVSACNAIYMKASRLEGCQAVGQSA